MHGYTLPKRDFELATKSLKIRTDLSQEEKSFRYINLKIDHRLGLGFPIDRRLRLVQLNRSVEKHVESVRRNKLLSMVSGRAPVTASKLVRALGTRHKFNKVLSRVEMEMFFS